MGILRWAFELRRIDLAHSCSLMTRFSNAPRTDHLDKVLGIFSYVKKHLQSRLVFDYQSRNWSKISWIEHVWSEFYPDAFECMPMNAHKPRGKAM